MEKVKKLRRLQRNALKLIESQTAFFIECVHKKVLLRSLLWKSPQQDLLIPWANKDFIRPLITFAYVTNVFRLSTKLILISRSTCQWAAG